MYDRRGHGLSEKPETGYTWQVHADDLAALIAALGLERPKVIGHSGGRLRRRSLPQAARSLWRA